MTSRLRGWLILVLAMIGAAALPARSWSRAIQLEEAAIRQLVDRGYAVAVDASHGRALRAPYPPRWFCWLVGRADFRNAIEVTTEVPGAADEQPFRPDAPIDVFFSRHPLRPVSDDLRQVGHLPRLQRLTLQQLDRSPDDRSLGQAFERLKHCRQLSQVTIRHTDFRDTRGLPFLRHWQELTQLDLSGSAIDNQGLADIIRHCPHLETLNLSGTGVDDAGLKRIDRLGQLTALDLSHTRVTEQAEQAARRRLRHITPAPR